MALLNIGKKEQDDLEKKAQTVAAKYRSVFFGSPIGRSVLHDILKMLCFYQNEYPEWTPAEREKARYVAQRILAKLGIWVLPNYPQITDTLSRITLPLPGSEKNKA